MNLTLNEVKAERITPIARFSRVYEDVDKYSLQSEDQIKVSGHGLCTTTEVIYKNDGESVDTMVWLRGGFHDSIHTVTEHRYTPDGKTQILGSFVRGSREHHTLLDKCEEEEARQNGGTER